MATLKIENLNAYYGTAQVLWDVSITVQSGEIVALIGANGAGKTSLMRTISGLMQKKDGSILLNDIPILNESAANIVRSGMAQVPEGRHLFSGMSIQDNLMMGAFLIKDKQLIKEDLERVYRFFPKLSERRKQLTGKLSGGEQQMCAIGRALMSHPQILLVDELSLGLAPVIIDELLEILQQLRMDGLSILLVEQDVQAGLEISDRAYALEHGKIVMSGSSQEMMLNPKIKESYLGI